MYLALSLFLLLLSTSPFVFAQRELDGVKLRCCTVLASPYAFRSGKYSHGYDGLVIEYLHLLQDRSGFQCSSLKPFEDDSGAVGWNALVENIVSCTDENGSIKNHPNCNCDVGVGAWFETPNRLDIDFLPAFSYDDRRVLVNVKDTSFSNSGTFFLTAFEPLVWGLIAVLVLLFAGLKLLDRRFAPRSNEYQALPASEGRFRRCKYFLLKNNNLYRMRRALQSVCSQLIGQNHKQVQGDFGSTRQWVLNFVVALSGLFLVLVYEATMTASLVQESVRSDFSGLQDFKSCRIPDKEVCLIKGDTSILFWDTAVANEDCRKDSKSRPQLFNSYEEALEKVAAGDCKFMLTDGGLALDAAHGKYCQKLTVAGEPFSQGGLHYLLPKGSQYLRPLRKATLELRSENRIETLDGFFEKKGKCDISTNPVVSIGKLKIFFIMSFIAAFLLFLEMVLDPQSIRKGKNGKNRKQQRREGEEAAKAKEKNLQRICSETSTDSSCPSSDDSQQSLSCIKGKEMDDREKADEAV